MRVGKYLIGVLIVLLLASLGWATLAMADAARTPRQRQRPPRPRPSRPAPLPRGVICVPTIPAWIDEMTSEETRRYEEMWRRVREWNEEHPLGEGDTFMYRDDGTRIRVRGPRVAPLSDCPEQMFNLTNHPPSPRSPVAPVVPDSASSTSSNSRFCGSGIATKDENGNITHTPTVSDSLAQICFMSPGEHRITEPTGEERIVHVEEVGPGSFRTWLSTPTD